ncbi:hypothetical protein BDZ97DRAFT_1074094 [Flammula alnicola]|nr:hypothetical protein BDZ97DRAFT_1074094 [Flammula alnicola]
MLGTRVNTSFLFVSTLHCYLLSFPSNSLTILNLQPVLRSLRSNFSTPNPLRYPKLRRSPLIARNQEEFTISTDSVRTQLHAVSSRKENSSWRNVLARR